MAESSHESWGASKSMTPTLLCSDCLLILLGRPSYFFLLPISCLSRLRDEPKEENHFPLRHDALVWDVTSLSYVEPSHIGYGLFDLRHEMQKKEDEQRAALDELRQPLIDKKNS